MPLITVAIPTYNRAEVLERAIKSVLSQEGDFFEVLIGDNASPDNTPDVIKPYLSDPRFRYYRNPINLGMQENILKIAREATGNYIFMLTDDDYLVPDALAKVKKIIETHPEVSYILSHLPSIDERSGKITNWHCAFAVDTLLQPDIKGMAHFVQASWVLSRQVLKKEHIDWAVWEKYRHNIFFPIIVAGRLLLQHPAYYLANHLVMHTYFNPVFWQAFGRDELNIQFNLLLDNYKCLRLILSDYEPTLEIEQLINEWELRFFKNYLYLSHRGFYDLIKAIGLRPALQQLHQAYSVTGHKRLELYFFFPLKIFFIRLWVNLKTLIRSRFPNVMQYLRQLRAGR